MDRGIPEYLRNVPMRILDVITSKVVCDRLHVAFGTELPEAEKLIFM
jgi:hypothetical protein